MGTEQVIEPVATLFLKEGVLGAIILIETFTIAYLFRKVMALQEQRVADIREESEKHQEATKEMIRVVATNTSTLDAVKVSISTRVGV